MIRGNGLTFLESFLFFILSLVSNPVPTFVSATQFSMRCDLELHKIVSLREDLNISSSNML